MSPRGNTLTVTQWFLLDRWILKRFTVLIEGPDGPNAIRGEIKLDFKAAHGASEFTLKPEAIEGCEKHDGEVRAGSESVLVARRDVRRLITR